MKESRCSSLGKYCGMFAMKNLLLVIQVVSLPNLTLPQSLPLWTNQLIILTQGRSGSSFVGELTSKIPGALYLYEPCRSIEMTFDAGGEGKFNQVKENDCQGMVGRLLDCSITNDDAAKLFQDWVAISKCNMRSIVDLAPKRIEVADKSKGYNKICSKASLRIVKEIRLVTPGQALLKRPGMALLHLVRDVRAVVNSRLHVDGFCLHKGAAGCAKPICEEIAATMAGTESIRHTARYRLVRFEQVCDHPLEAAKQIFNWLGFAMTLEGAEWIEASTHSQQVCMYALARFD
mmetsp:Transcript_65678/g.128918  ORF Transcript_65678/g.128918 Transcript_65678/m.128918 type:complete len:290 (+) Transcript_65678:1-870(+)